MTTTHPLTEDPSDPSLALAIHQDLPLLLSLIGDRVLLAHPRRTIGTAGGGDVDLFVDGMDPNWPLRLPEGWRLCQVLHYDVLGWYWVLDHDGETLALDTVADPTGLGRDGMPTRRLLDLAERHPAAARAAYLATKRIRKGIREPREWERIVEGAATAPAAYREALSWPFGRRLAGAVASDRVGIVPPDRLFHIGRVVLWLRRRATPRRLVDSLRASAGRWYRRVAHPTGLFVLVVGPDGTGKSSLASVLPEICEGPFRRTRHAHWRPGVLPRAGALIGAPQADPTKPHAQAPHGPVTSLASLGYHWLDFLLGGWLRIRPFRVRSGLFVLERGWWDIAVDPARYRIGAPRWLVRLLGALQPSPDLVLVLEAPPEVLLGRKAEVPADELTRQSHAWRSVLPRRVRRVYLDTARPEPEVRAAAREAVFSLLTERASGRYGPGWMGLPTSSAPRWLIPRGPRGAARPALTMYQPVTTRARLGWTAGRAMAAAGLFRLTPRAAGPPEPVRELVGKHVPSGGSIALTRTNHPNRYVALVLGPGGTPTAVAKVALDAAGIARLEGEAIALEEHAPRLVPPLSAPRILEREPRLLLLEALPWRPRRRPWLLPPDVAFSLGRAFSDAGGDPERGMAHGDFAPWNLLQTPTGWALVDWEDARPDAPPFFDVFHFLVQSAVLLGRPRLRELPEMDTAWIQDAIRAYARGGGLDASTWRRHLREYVTLTIGSLDPSVPEQAAGLAARKRLLEALR